MRPVFSSRQRRRSVPLVLTARVKSVTKTRPPVTDGPVKPALMGVRHLTASPCLGNASRMPVSFQTPRRPRPRHSGQSSAGASWQLSVKARSMAMRFIMIIMIVTRDAAFQAARRFASGGSGKPIAAAPQHLLYFRPEPQGQGAQRAIGAGAGGWVAGPAGSVTAAIGVASRL